MRPSALVERKNTKRTHYKTLFLSQDLQYNSHCQFIQIEERQPESERESGEKERARKSHSSLAPVIIKVLLGHAGSK